MIFAKIILVFPKNYEKNVKSVKFVILTIAIFIYMTIMIFGSWHSGFLSANKSKIMLLKNSHRDLGPRKNESGGPAIRKGT